MALSSATHCGRCGAVLPSGAGASAGGLCPACGQPVDPDATWRPGPAPAPPLAVVELPPQVPLAALAALAVFCALMGLGLGVWLGWGRGVPVRRAAVPLPPLPPPGPALAPQWPAPRFYRAPTAPANQWTLPPARVTPPPIGRGSSAHWSPSGRAFAPLSHLPLAPPRLPAGPEAPLKAAGMATVNVNNPSGAAVDVTLSGRGGQVGVVGPHAAVDFLIPPGRYDIALRGPARTQRIYDAPLREGDVLALVYSARPAERPDETNRER
jgi:hypothetical protein